MAAGITVALREHALGIGGINGASSVLLPTFSMML